jgi:sec-independent protein translocase protein TatA
LTRLSALFYDAKERDDAPAKMLSVPHLVIIFLVALIVFGPEKLPELARTFGKAMTEFRRATGDLRAGFEEHMRELERETTIREAQKKPVEPPKAELISGSAASAPVEASPAAPEAVDSIAPVTQAAEPVSVAPQIPETVPEKAAKGDV